MSELQIVSLIMILAGALPCFLLAQYIEKGKHYSLFSGWDPVKISDENAYGEMICKGIRGFSLVMGLGCFLVLFNIAGVVLFVGSIAIFPTIPLIFYIVKAKKCYGK